MRHAPSLLALSFIPRKAAQNSSMIAGETVRFSGGLPISRPLIKPFGPSASNL